MSYHDVWEQETIPVILTTRKVRQGIREIQGQNVLIRRINKKYFFGFDYQKEGDYFIPYSDLEKTFIDMIYFNEILTKETEKNLIKQINKVKLNNYLNRYPLMYRTKVFKYFKKGKSQDLQSH